MFRLKLGARLTAQAEAAPVSAEDFARRIGARAHAIERARPVTPVRLELTPAPQSTTPSSIGDAAEPGAGDAEAEATTRPEPAADADRLRRLLDYDRQDLEDFLAQLQQVAEIPLAATALLPTTLWDGELGLELIGRFDLSPWRPWNAVVLPADDRGALELGLPVPPRQLAEDHDAETARDIAGLIALSLGESDADAERAEPLADAVDALRADHPELFPADQDGLDPAVVEVRARLKSYAVYRAAMIGLPVAAVETAHRTFLPEMEALAN